MITGRKRVMSRCGCGKVKSRDSRTCRTCHNNRMEGFKNEAQKIIDIGRCPECGDSIERNMALSGWWQCANFGQRKMRNGRADNADCGWQAFGH